MEIHNDFKVKVHLWKSCASLWEAGLIFDVISLAHLLAFRQNPPSRLVEESVSTRLDIAQRASGFGVTIRKERTLVRGAGPEGLKTHTTSWRLWRVFHSISTSVEI
jgi:hypothetical protein